MKNWWRLRAIKASAVAAIMPRSEHVSEPYWPTVYAFTFSYSVGRMVVEAANSLGLKPDDARILIVGAWGGRDWHWLTGFGFRPDTLDLGHHPWAPTTFVGDACEIGTWATVPKDYDLVILCDVLEHLPRDYDALLNIRASLKPQGRLLLSVPFHHDAETTHVRSYTDVTLRRLLGFAGYEVHWAKRRPGLLEAMPWACQSLNYAAALVCPSPVWGGRVIAKLLSWEYRLNEHTRVIFGFFGLSPQKGMIYYCRPAEAADNLMLQMERHLPSA